MISTAKLKRLLCNRICLILLLSTVELTLAVIYLNAYKPTVGIDYDSLITISYFFSYARESFGEWTLLLWAIYPITTCIQIMLMRKKTDIIYNSIFFSAAAASCIITSAIYIEKGLFFYKIPIISPIIPTFLWVAIWLAKAKIGPSIGRATFFNFLAQAFFRFFYMFIALDIFYYIKLVY